MSEDSLERLKVVGAQVLETFAAWSKKKKDHALAEAASEAVHELRKVAARLEIELVTAERENQTAEPLAIPSHRSAGPMQQAAPGGDDDTPAPRRRLKADTV